MYNIYKELNKIIDYIEEHILEKIDLITLAHMSGLNINMLKNIFTCLAGISITEYIRYRRLSLATRDILNGESITDIALKYHYSSLSSFTRSYKKFSGISPKEVRNSEKLKMFNKIIFKENINNYNLDYKIKNIEFNLYSVSKKMPYEESYKYIKPFWEEVKRNNPEFNEGIRYG
ncbi:MAG: AraC family transcriptional regulator, partial [Bacilli bacterium]|nr:AraC family transcriptional regulator [Bacilli bacterium]